MIGELLTMIGAGVVLWAGFGSRNAQVFSVPDFPSLSGEDVPVNAMSVREAEGTASNLPRGIRNKNPGNIEWSAANNWRGQIGNDGRYIIFETPHYGLRALARLLNNYDRLYGLDTVYGIINRWAPNTENNTSSYIRAVSDKLGVDPLQSIDVMDRLPELVAAVVHHENGMQPYTSAQINAGVAAI